MRFPFSRRKGRASRSVFRELEIEKMKADALQQVLDSNRASIKGYKQALSNFVDLEERELIERRVLPMGEGSLSDIVIGLVTDFSQQGGVLGKAASGSILTFLTNPSNKAMVDEHLTHYLSQFVGSLNDKQINDMKNYSKQVLEKAK